LALTPAKIARPWTEHEACHPLTDKTMLEAANELSEKPGPALSRKVRRTAVRRSAASAGRGGSYGGILSHTATGGKRAMPAGLPRGTLDLQSQHRYSLFS